MSLVPWLEANHTMDIGGRPREATERSTNLNRVLQLFRQTSVQSLNGNQIKLFERGNAKLKTGRMNERSSDERGGTMVIAIQAWRCCRLATCPELHFRLQRQRQRQHRLQRQRRILPLRPPRTARPTAVRACGDYSSSCGTQTQRPTQGSWSCRRRTGPGSTESRQTQAAQTHDQRSR